ncbi:sigma-70 family RNA polymerase sigma factor [Pendulispora rubella]|uniref:Sigma-70 family RNA polymerase sigma factor n=1 Tax=Pendulispora rubella TaxID=2741070 RepID=A0ABZ2KWA1_9BACT
MALTIEASVIGRAVAGERAAIDALIRALVPHLEHLVRRYRLADDERMDLAQTALLQIVHRLEAFPARESFLGWVFRITVNEARRMMRHKRRARAYFVTGFDLDELDALVVSHDPGTNAGGNLDEAERNAWIRSALGKLPEPDRGVFLAYHVLDFHLNEVAKEFALTRDTVRIRLGHGRRWLCALLLNGTSDLSRLRYSAAACGSPWWGAGALRA